MSTGQGSAGNVIAALASFFLPGLGQLAQGRILAALVHFIATIVLRCFMHGWLGHLWSAYIAATWRSGG